MMIGRRQRVLGKRHAREALHVTWDARHREGKLLWLLDRDSKLLIAFLKQIRKPPRRLRQKDSTI